MIATPKDSFDEWMGLPVPGEPDDRRFTVRRAAPEEFERIYDLVDLAFGRKRPRPLYDWLYRENPFGLARSWIVLERETGELLKAGTNFPWPIWRGEEEVPLGVFSGDHVTAPRWQRQGLTAVRRQVRQTHPWDGRGIAISGPNAASRIVIQKAGDGDELLGALRGGIVVFRSRALLGRAGLPGLVATPASYAADALLSLWQRAGARSGRGAGARIEEVRRFSVDFDDVTLRTMSFPKFWCPHNADFLNWRYLDHPVESYVGFAMVEDERPTGYAVLRLAGEGATLSEFAVEPSPTPRAVKLLSHVLSIAREAGCGYLNFFASPSWRHWGLFRRVGFIPYRTPNHLDASGRQYEPEVQDMRNWQLLPGDRDYH